MMDWYGYSMGSGGWAAMILGMAVLCGLIILAAIAILGAGRNRGAAGTGEHDAQAILDERYARGEIDRDQYDERKAVLHGDTHTR